MTLPLKDYNQLKKQFNDGVASLLERDHVESADKLGERREQVKFIQHIIQYIDIYVEKMSNLEKSKPREIVKTQRSMDEAALTLYGAMSLISTLITEEIGFKRYVQGSFLRDHLDLMMYKSADAPESLTLNTPTNSQLRSFYKRLNHFFTLIYISRDSRLGIKSNNLFHEISLDTLASFMEKSFAQEELYQRKALEDYEMTDSPPSTYKPKEDVAEEVTEWKQLSEELNKLKNKELGLKRVADINGLNPRRALQLNFLLTIARNLEKSNIKAIEKATILTGAMYIVHAQINKEYGADLLNHQGLGSIIQAGSLIHTDLTEIIKAKNYTPQKKEALVHAANHYILHMTTDQQNEKIRKKHIFSSIKDFNLPQFAALNQEFIKTCRTVALKQAVENYKALLVRPSNDKVSVLNFSSLWAGSNTATESKLGDATPATTLEP